MLVYFAFHVAINLVQQVDSGLFFGLPLLVLSLLLFQSLLLDQPVELSLVSKRIFMPVLCSSEGPLGLLSFFFLHFLFILSKLPLFGYNSFDHLSVFLSFSLLQLFPLLLYSLIMVLNLSHSNLSFCLHLLFLGL